MVATTRDALLRAARARFSINGYSGTSIRDIAADVGIRESSVYKHFPSKEAIFDALLAHAEERVASVADALDVEVSDPATAARRYIGATTDSLTAIADRFLTLWLHDPDFAPTRRMLAIDQFRRPDAGKFLRAITVQRPLEFQTQVMAALMECGEFRADPDPQAVALAFWGPILAIASMAEDPSLETEGRALLRRHIEHFVGTHVLPQPEGGPTP